MKKYTVIITSYITAAFLILGGFLLKFHNENVRHERYIQHSYQHAFSELVTSMGEIDAALQKSVYATSPSMISAVCTQVYGKAMQAEMAMGELPFSCYELENTAAFITRVGDYAYSLSRNASSGEGYTDEEHDNLVSLAKSANLLSDNLTQLYGDIQSGSISVTEIAQADSSAEHTGDSIATLGDSFKLIEQEFPEIPSLIYDGPFSEHITDMESQILKDSENITEKEALEIAARFTGLKSSSLTLAGSREGDMPVYTINGRAYGGEITIEITKAGGHVSYYSNNRDVGDSEMSSENAVEAAELFLSQHGYKSMEHTYWTTSDDIITINFAYSQNGVICYNDLIKVSVALDNGRVVGLESKGYIMNHHERDIPKEEIPREDAQKAVATDLKILSHGMAVIPTMGKNEVYCHEFKCENSDGRHYIVYVNAITGNQENILILIEDESGTLTL
ncbi:MAG: germination protein YpeB [Ruminococcaceae bacterium]|nr:germination protein YpeB [Oscillospiraceae bacterium]